MRLKIFLVSTRKILKQVFLKAINNRIIRQIGLKSKEVSVYSSDFVIHRITKQSRSQSSCSKSERKNVIRNGYHPCITCVSRAYLQFVFVQSGKRAELNWNKPIQLLSTVYPPVSITFHKRFEHHTHGGKKGNLKNQKKDQR